MSIKKVTLASLILLGLTACSSGGSGGSSNNVAKPNTKPQTTQQQTDKAAAEKAAKEKAEAERLAAEKAAREKAAIDSHKSFFYPIQNNFQSWANPTITQFQLSEDAKLGLTRNIKETVHQEVRNDVETDATYTRQYDLYNQKYSIVVGERTKYHNPKNDYGFEINHEKYSIIDEAGLKTAPSDIPKEGVATYSGKAFNANEDGTLTYTVDFTNKEGYGKIEGMSELGTIELEKGTIVKKVSSNRLEINSDVKLASWKEYQVTGQYNLAFFGEKAEEVAGNISLRQEHSIYNPETGNIDVNIYLAIVNQ
ncbi:factor H binding protein domain-containing protein [Mannheimia glucosida]|uniref:factor H binding protein domain-containing protein n=1 Tax=Mannheimia glucosida TaxID=85401 RepID=UPI0039183E1F